jgi:hypothetical protein
VSKKKDEIGPKLEALALKVMADAENASEPNERLDGFRAVAAYYVSVTKIRAKIPDDGDESEQAGSFDNLRKRLIAVK